MTTRAKDFFDVKGQCQGLQGTPSQKNIKSISNLIDGLKKIQKNFICCLNGSGQKVYSLKQNNTQQIKTAHLRG